MVSPHERLRILELIIAEALDADRLAAARLILENATDEQIQRVLRLLARHGVFFFTALFLITGGPMDG